MISRWAAARSGAWPRSASRRAARAWPGSRTVSASPSYTAARTRGWTKLIVPVLNAVRGDGGFRRRISMSASWRAVCHASADAKPARTATWFGSASWPRIASAPQKAAAGGPNCASRKVTRHLTARGPISPRRSTQWPSVPRLRRQPRRRAHATTAGCRRWRHGRRGRMRPALFRSVPNGRAGRMRLCSAAPDAAPWPAGR